MKRETVHILAGAAVLLCAIFAFRGFERADLWSDPMAASEAAAERYPDGSIAWYLRGRAAAEPSPLT